jgi:protoheme IX farnesyltransferase
MYPSHRRFGLNKSLATQQTFGSAVIQRLRDYWALSKPRVTLLVWITNLFGMLLAGAASPGPIAINLLGAWFVIAAANVLNQVIEAVPDSQMSRTRNRPIPAGRVTPIEATLLGIVWAAAGLLILALWVNPLTACLGAVSIGLYALAYTPLKRITHLCTVVGAIPGAIPPLAGWAAVTGTLNPPAFLLFAIQFFWQFPHFWAIAWLLREDYATVGFKMLPYPDADGKSTAVCALKYSLPVLPLSLAYAFLLSKPWLYVPLAMLAGWWLLSAAIRFVNSPDDLAARRVLKASIGYMPAVLMAMMICR